MGDEARRTTITIDGRDHEGDALLETDEVFLRIEGEPKRRRLERSALANVRATESRLSFEHAGQRFELEVPSPARWARKISSPRSLLDKLGIAEGSRVHVVGIDDAEFTRALHAAKVVPTALGADARVVVYGITTRADLAFLREARAAVGDALVLWVVHPKGKKELSEDHVREAAREAGLVDVLVARFSATHSALKLVVRKSERGAKKR